MARKDKHVSETPATQFLRRHGVKNQRLHKIAEGREPNIKSFLSRERLDLVMVGNEEYWIPDEERMADARR